MFPWCHSVSVPVIQYTHKKVTSVKSSTWTFSLRPDQPVLQPPDLITSSWCDKPVVLLQNPLPSLQLKLHSHERWCLILLLLSTFPSFPFPNCCSQVSQSALAPSLTALHHSAVPCISHRAIVPWLFCSEDVLVSYTTKEIPLFPWCSKSCPSFPLSAQTSWRSTSSREQWCMSYPLFQNQPPIKLVVLSIPD